jgi:uncharacterized protein (TIGR02687 family)
MNVKQVTDSLAAIFATQRIVFWNDPAKDFLSLFDGEMFSPVEGVQVLRLDQMPALQVKLRVEREAPESRFLLYSPTPEPEDPLNDWLLDIRLYAHTFYADRGSLDLEALGLTTASLREHLNLRRSFLDSKDRFARLKNLVHSDDTADDLDRKMAAVAIKSDQAEDDAILRTLLHAFTEADDAIDLGEPPAVWGPLEKYGLDAWFWRNVKKRFGYTEDTPRLGNLCTRLFVTDFVQSLSGAVPQPLENLLLPAAGRNNAVVFMGRWRDSASRGASYDALSEEVAHQISLDTAMAGLDLEALLGVQTFLAVEKAIASMLRDRVIDTAEQIDADAITAISTRRQAGHWASPTIPGSAPRKQLHSVYEALARAADFFELVNRHRLGFEGGSPDKLYEAYTKSLYRFDQLYRLFCEQADQTRSWDILKRLREEMERAYANWFVPTLALAWDRHLPELLSTWSLEGIPNQTCFFSTHVQPRLAEGENRKAFVVISDAFRYEAAQELAQELSGTYRLTASLTSQLAVLPSYTALGMASLLPHQQLAYDSKGAMLADGQSTAGVAARSAILSSVDGLAITADDLLAMRKEEARQLTSGKRVVYVYHNAVDSVGDSAATEGETFAAVRRAIDELSEIVRTIVNSLNGNYVVVTADHGFLYTDTPPAETSRSLLGQEPPGTVVAKKRYLLGRGLPDSPEAFHGTTAVTATAAGEMEWYLPKGTNLFHFSGGARFVHGGAALQEVVVPVITVKHVKTKARAETAIKTVGIQVLGVNHKITTPRYRFQLLQTEAVSDRVRPVTGKLAVYDGQTVVTNIATLTFGSNADSIAERTQEVVLTLADTSFDRTTAYRLVLRDAETGIELAGIPVTIDRAFTDDF